MQCEVTDTIPKGLQPYRPEIYRGIIITDENDDYRRFYSMSGRQLGWARSVEKAKAFIDAIIEEMRGNA